LILQSLQIQSSQLLQSLLRFQVHRRLPQVTLLQRLSRQLQHLLIQQIQEQPQVRAIQVLLMAVPLSVQAVTTTLHLFHSIH
jgi:hypothetical protein